MNMTNKFSSLIGSLIIAFAITLFLPATVNAKGHSSCNTGKNSHGSHGSYGKGSHGSHGSYGKGSHGSHGSWGKGSHGSHGSYGKGSHGSHGSYGKGSHGSHGSWGKGSHGSSTTSNCNDYKTLANRYLNAYYKCYNYTYYRYYVYFIKKYNQCKADTPVVTNCDKYKDLAQRYLDAYKKCGNSCYYQYYLYYMKKYNNCQANTVQTGKVCGLVFEDTDGNGVQDAGEANYAGAKVTITDVNGKAVTVTTDAQGKYCKDGIEEGEATIEVDLNSLPAGATITTENPTTIDVDAGTKNQAGKDGYTLPTPTPTGTVCGTVFVDVNKNKLQEYGEPGIPNISVTITDVNGKNTIVETDAEGKYCVSGIAEGEATIDVDEDDSDMPAGSEETTFTDPSTVNVIANTNNNAGIDGYYNPNTGLGCICTVVYLDKNQSGKHDSGDEGIANITVTIVDSLGNTHQVETDKYGYMYAVVPVGEVTLTVDTKDEDMPENVIANEGKDKNPITFENTMGSTNITDYGYTPTR